MERRTRLFWGVLIFVLLMATLTVIFNQQQVSKEMKFKMDSEHAVFLAQGLYRKAVKEGVKFSSGPCLTNDLMPGWVADIVHNPRQPVDDLPGNQCQAYLEGRAKHFVELDLKGNVVRVK